MSEENKQNKYITRTELEEQTQIILGAFDKRFVFLGKHLDEVRDDLRIDINNLQTLIDGYVKSQEAFKQEFVIMKEEFRQIKKIIKEKFGVEIGAIS